MNTKPDKVVLQAPEGIDWLEWIEEIPDTALEQTGMADTSFSSDSIMLHEMTGTALLLIHSLQPFAALSDGMAACDVRLPAAVNQSLGQDPTAICLAPGQWLLFSEYLGCSRLFEQVHTAVEFHHTAVLDLSDGLTVLRLSGRGSPWLLNKLCGLDFQRDIDAPAYGTRTRMQQAAVTVHYHRPGGFTSESVYDLIVDRSIALYVWQLLIASMPHAEELEQHFGTQT